MGKRLCVSLNFFYCSAPHVSDHSFFRPHSLLLHYAVTRFYSAQRAVHDALGGINGSAYTLDAAHCVIRICSKREKKK